MKPMMAIGEAEDDVPKEIRLEIDIGRLKGKL